jgi:hypothetical protein
MHTLPGGPDMTFTAGRRPVLSILLWIAVSVGWLVSTFSVVEEMCLASACRDTANFTVFGFNMGWFGIAYFSLILMLLWLRRSVYRLDWAVTALVFAGIGAEFRLLWIQKYLIGSWCPLCVTICCALFIAAMLLVIERIRLAGIGKGRGTSLLGWLLFAGTMIVAGLMIAFVEVLELT